MYHHTVVSPLVQKFVRCFYLLEAGTADNKDVQLGQFP